MIIKDYVRRRPCTGMVESRAGGAVFVSSKLDKLYSGDTLIVVAQ